MTQDVILSCKCTGSAAAQIRGQRTKYCFVTSAIYLSTRYQIIFLRSNNLTYLPNAGLLWCTRNTRGPVAVCALRSRYLASHSRGMCAVPYPWWSTAVRTVVNSASGIKAIQPAADPPLRLTERPAAARRRPPPAAPPRAPNTRGSGCTSCARACTRRRYVRSAPLCDVMYQYDAIVFDIQLCVR